MAREASKNVPIAGVDNKRQITAVFGVTVDGIFLPPQLIYTLYQGTVIPLNRNKISRRLGCHLYIQSRRQQYNISIMSSYLLFPSRKKRRIYQAVLKDSLIDTVFVPAYCTDQ